MRAAAQQRHRTAGAHAVTIAKYRATAHDALVIRCNHDIDAIAPQKSITAELPTSARLRPQRLHPRGVLQSIHPGTKTMRRTSMGTAGLVVVAMAASVAGAGAEDQAACGKIRAACQGAGFVEGAAR